MNRTDMPVPDGLAFEGPRPTLGARHVAAIVVGIDYFAIEGTMRWVFIILFMTLKAGLIVAVFMHMIWERMALIYAILVPPLALGALVWLMWIESDYTFSAGGGLAAEAVPMDLGTLLAAADPARGESVGRVCASCHTFEPGGPTGSAPISGVSSGDRSARRRASPIRMRWRATAAPRPTSASTPISKARRGRSPATRCSMRACAIPRAAPISSPGSAR